MNDDRVSLAVILGPWIEPEWQSGLIEQCRSVWSKPLRDLTNAELAMLLRQHFAVEQLLLIARQRVSEGFDDDTELWEGELTSAIEHASKTAS
ncbi:MAG: contact-dependent growth inhibition system immunity protein [Verrucomicrobiota bacterium]